MQPKIIPLAMIICDTIIQDAISGKKSLIGVFSRINSKNMPLQHPRMNIFLVLTEGNGPYKCELRCLDGDNNQPIVQTHGEIEFQDPRQIVELMFDFSGIVFPDYGMYRFEFLCDGEPVISRKFEVAQIEK